MDRLEKMKKAVEEGEEIGPELVMISPTDKCNLRCRTCWRRDKEGEKFEEGLSLEKIKEVLNDCRKLNVNKIDFTGGGEPFLRDEIFDMIKEAKDRGFGVGLTTNSELLNRSKITKLVEKEIDEILLSLDGLEQTNDFIRGEGVYESVVQSLETFQNTNYEGILGISTVITSKNSDELLDIVKLGESKDVDYVNFIVMNLWDSNEEFDPRDKREKITEELERVRKFEKGSDVDTNADNITGHGLAERDPPNFCFAPWDMAFINASGEMMACCTLASYYKNLLGNLEENSFYELWTGDRLEEFRKEIKNGEFREKCKECIPDFIEKYNNLFQNMKDKNLEIG